MSSVPDEPAAGRHAAAVLAAWAVPGMGHYLLGEKKRGAILACVIGSLWLAGLLIGGIGSFDYRHNLSQSALWFIGQWLVAPSVAVDLYHQQLKATGSTLPPSTYNNFEQPVYVPSFGRVREQAVLYTALAGMLNLLTILDVIFDPTQRRRAKRAATATDG